LQLRPYVGLDIQACNHLSSDPRTSVLPLALTAEHFYQDDLGQMHRDGSVQLTAYQARPNSGPGWIGSSRILPESVKPENEGRYNIVGTSVSPVTLDQLTTSLLALFTKDQIDYMKMDCEGCENSALGCASTSTLEKIRFISGEYHDFYRFYDVVKGKLQQTHLVNFVGGAWGSFFAERKAEAPTILSPNRVRSTQSNSEWPEYAFDCHPFNKEYVASVDFRWHGLV
jgi:hypothetical protein